MSQSFRVAEGLGYCMLHGLFGGGGVLHVRGGVSGTSSPGALPALADAAWQRWGVFRTARPCRHALVSRLSSTIATSRVLSFVS